MTDELKDAATEKPSLAESISGRNSWTLSCEPRNQQMQFASCVARQGAISAPGVRVPDDWKECGRHATHGNCIALKMRREEQDAGHSIYVRKAAEVGKTLAERWLSKPAGGSRVSASAPSRALPTPTPRPPVPKPVVRVSDALGDAVAASDYSNVVNKMAAEHRSSAPAPAPVPIVRQPLPTPATPITHTAGESPLQMARRINAERAALKQAQGEPS